MRVRRGLLALLLVALAVTYFSVNVAQKATLSDNLPASKGKKAFLNASWGMSKAEVETVNGKLLQKPSSRQRFYDPPKGTEDRYEIWQVEGQNVLGRPAILLYSFFDGKLFAYHVFMTDMDEEVLDETVRGYLVRTYGEDFSEEAGPLKMIWQTKELTVNYWFYKVDLSVTTRFKAGFGVLNRALEKRTSVDS